MARPTSRGRASGREGVGSQRHRGLDGTNAQLAHDHPGRPLQGVDSPGRVQREKNGNSGSELQYGGTTGFCSGTDQFRAAPESNGGIRRRM